MKSLFFKTLTADIITTFLCLGPIVLSLSLSWTLLAFIENVYLKFIAAPFILVFGFILIIFIIRLLLPSLKKGVFPIGMNMGFMGWLTHSMLTRSARVFGIHYLIHSVSFFRWLYWRALGAKVSYKISTSYKITLHDIALIELAEGIILAEDTEISGHLVRGDRVLVAPVKIGKNTFVGRSTYIGPRTTIGENCWIGMNNTVTGEILPAGTKIANHAWEKGNPKRQASTDNLS
jgi:acetyltransferase-like isoleucine patch superfamily enzyme